MKVVINTRYGGFDLSHEAVLKYAEKRGLSVTFEAVPTAGYIYNIINSSGEKKSFNPNIDIARDDQVLIQVIEELGVEQSSTKYCDLKIIEIPYHIKWHINSNDGGKEWIAEEHRTWD